MQFRPGQKSRHCSRRRRSRNFYKPVSSRTVVFCAQSSSPITQRAGAGGLPRTFRLTSLQEVFSSVAFSLCIAAARGGSNVVENGARASRTINSIVIIAMQTDAEIDARKTRRMQPGYEIARLPLFCCYYNTNTATTVRDDSEARVGYVSIIRVPLY